MECLPRISLREGSDRLASEKNFENRIKTFLKEHGCWHVKYWGGGEYTKAGVPDILACVNGYFFGIEVKAPRGHPSKLQLYNLKKIDAAGGYGILLYPNQYEIFKDLVESFMEGDKDAIQDLYGQLKERWWDDANVTQ